MSCRDSSKRFSFKTNNYRFRSKRSRILKIVCDNWKRGLSRHHDNQNKSSPEVSCSQFKLRSSEEKGYEDSRKFDIDSAGANNAGCDGASARSADTGESESGWSSSHHIDHGTRSSLCGAGQLR